MTPKQQHRLRLKVQSALTRAAELVETMHDQHIVGNSENRAVATAVIYILTRFRDACESKELTAEEIGDEIVRTKLRILGRRMFDEMKQKKPQ